MSVVLTKKRVKDRFYETVYGVRVRVHISTENNKKFEYQHKAMIRLRHECVYVSARFDSIRCDASMNMDFRL